jgi:hypothetical protein
MHNYLFGPSCAPRGRAGGRGTFVPRGGAKFLSRLGEEGARSLSRSSIVAMAAHRSEGGPLLAVPKRRQEFALPWGGGVMGYIFGGQRLVPLPMLARVAPLSEAPPLMPVVLEEAAEVEETSVAPRSGKLLARLSLKP